MSGKNERIKYWKDLIDKSNRLTADEYLQMLHEIRAHAGFTLLEKAMYGIEDGVQAYVSTVDKVHWLLDSAEKKQIRETADVNITFELSGPPEKDKAAQAEA
jgi:hypothetical protein